MPEIFFEKKVTVMYVPQTYVPIYTHTKSLEIGPIAIQNNKDAGAPRYICTNFFLQICHTLIQIIREVSINLIGKYIRR